MALISDNQVVEPTYNAGFVVLSYLVSFVGCATTLELLHRRTSCFGLYNWYLLITSSISMGGVGIWCMHFIGNRAIVFGDGASEHQIYYSSGFTAVSFFLPIAVLMLAFYLIGANEKASFIHIGVAGTMTGTAVSGMHYVGQLGIANYNCQYDIPNVVGAATIAVFASLVALTVFFVLRASWTNSWWKRTLCSLTLAVAVSGMHWTAAVGTSYVYRELDIEPETRLSSTQTVVVCTVLACAACILLIVFAIIANRKRKRTANRARQLVLACAFFDQSGRVMVTPEGLLPSHKITNHYIERTFADDEFSRSHPAFIWAFRATRNWAALKRLIPQMKEHLISNESSRQFCPGHGTTPDTGAELDVDFGLIFKELFCVAAQELADEIHQPLDKMGVLYEDVMATGTVAEQFLTNSQIAQQKGTAQSSSPPDLESGNVPFMFGKGQFLFAVRQLTKQDASRLSASGFRFAVTSQIAFTLSRSMQVPQEEVLNRLDRMREYSSAEKMMEPGVHIACFSLHPSIRRGFDVLVYSHARNILPFASLPLDHITQWQLDILSRMDDWSLTTCLRWLKGNGGGFTDPQDQAFCQKMLRAISSLAESINDSSFSQAKFSSRRIMVPCRPSPRSYTPGKCTVFFFRIVMGIHNRISGPQFTLSPLPFFNAQQQVYTGVADHENFLLQLHREFAHCSENKELTRKGSAGGITPSSSGITPPSSPTPSINWHGIRKSRLSRTASLLESTIASEVDDDDNNSTKTNMNSPGLPNPNPAFGGIMVSNQVTVDITEHSKNGHTNHSSNNNSNNNNNSSINNNNKPEESQSSFEMRDLGVTVEAGYANTCGETFVDELCAMCRVSAGQQSRIS